MTILGIGTDLVDLTRFEGVLTRHEGRFEKRIFDPSELAMADKRRYRVAFLGARFAAKEAVAKALGTGFGQGVEASQIIITGGGGAPCGATLIGAASDRAKALGVTRVWVSISHTDHHASATAVLEGRVGS